MFSSVQFSRSVVSDSVTLWIAACQASLSIINSQRLLKLMSIESVMQSSHLILCRPLFLTPSIFPSIRVFSNESVLRIRWLKYWSFSFSISPSNEYSGLISFRIDWPDLLVVQGTLKSLLQFSSTQSLSRVWLFATPWTAARQASLSITNSLSPPKPVSIKSVISSVIPFSSCPQSFPASRSFQMSQFFASGGQSVGVSASTSVLPMNTQDWSPLGCTG